MNVWKTGGSLYVDSDCPICDRGNSLIDTGSMDDCSDAGVLLFLS